ncbi:MAG: LamG domain-containing protein, partial [Verrucomicrobiota bacterium]
SRNNVTIEVWTTWNGPANNNWQRIFDFGDSQKGDVSQAPGNGLGYLFLTPRAGATGNPVRFAARPNGTTAESPVLNAPPSLPTGTEAHIVVVYAPEFRNSRLYVNGVLAATGDAPFALNALNDANCWLGASLYNDPPFNGRINEFRIYEGSLTDLEVALSRHVGPDNFAGAPGALQSIAVSAPALLLGNPAVTQGSLKANFQNVTGVEILGLSGITLTSSDNNIFTVNATGGLLPRAVGKATLTATFQNLTASTEVTVVAPTALRHELPATSLQAGQLLVNATLRADFPGADNVNINGYTGVTRASSDANVVTIAVNGNVAAVAPGTAKITSTFAGLSVETEFQVTLPPDFTRGQLIHRYSFNEAPDTITVEDSVGSADGEVVGLVAGSANNNFNGAGQLALAGSAWNANPLAAYVNLPNGLISSLGSVTIEGWGTWRGGAANQRFFDFGMSSGAPDGAGGFGDDVVLNPGRSYMFLTPSAGPRFAIKQGTGPETPSLTSSTALTANAPVHFAVVYDQPHGVVRLYINGVRTGTAAATLPLSVVDDRNNWLGRSNWQDPLVNALLDEFRIYNGPLLDRDIAATFAAGPNQVPDLTPPPALTVQRAGATLELLWPSTATGFTLETTTALGTAWTAVNASPVPDGSNQKVSLPIGAEPAFFRLKK